jgi:cyclophilin family peptidyl-prolyl cis-trans isomerase
MRLGRTCIQIEIKIQQFLAREFAGLAVAKTELPEHFNRGLALREGIHGDFQILILPAKRDSRFQQGLSNPAAAMVLAHSQPADLSSAFFVVLHSDHADYLAKLIFRDPKAIAFGVHVNGFDVVNIKARVVLGQLAAE